MNISRLSILYLTVMMKEIKKTNGDALMNDISITEAYFVYSVRGKGKLSGNDCRKVTGLLTAALWEMTQNGLLTLTDNRLCLNDVDHFTRSWFQPLYEHIREMESNDLSSLLQDYCSSWSDRHLNASRNWLLAQSSVFLMAGLISCLTSLPFRG